MAIKCLTATAQKGIFKQNTQHQDIFDLMPESGANLPFSYFRLSLPRSPYLIAQRAVFVAESFKNNIKVLNTGLRQTEKQNIYSGDILNTVTRKNSLILFKWIESDNSYLVYLFPEKYPRSLKPLLNEIAGV